MATNGLYDPSFEHDSCGIGFVANIKSNKSHQIVSDALTILENMEHRGACGCEYNSGDGAVSSFKPRMNSFLMNASGSVSIYPFMVNMAWVFCSFQKI